MRGRWVVVLLILVMSVVSLAAAGVSIHFLYRASLDEQQARLADIARGRARLIEAIHRDELAEADVSRRGTPPLADDDVLEILLDAHEHVLHAERAGEVTIAKLQGPNIVFLLRSRYEHTGVPHPVPLDSTLAEPMRRALSGQSGALVGLDYRGETVLAAYEPVEGLGWGVVAKMDVAEVRAPFRRAGVVAAAATLVLVLVGAAFLIGLSSPLVRDIERSERRYRELVEGLNEGIWVVDQDACTTFVNPRMAEMLRYAPEEMLGRPLFEFMDAQAAESCKQRLWPEQEGVTGEHESRFTCKDGSQIHAMVRLAPMTDESGQYAGAYASVADVTRRRQAEDAMRRAHEQAQTYLDIAGVLILALDATGRVTLINQRGCEILGAAPDEILGHDWFETFLPEAIREEIKAVFARLMAGEIEVTEYVENLVRTRRGDERMIAWHNTVLRDEQGAIVGTLTSGDDVTDLRRAEQAARVAQEKLTEILRQEKERAVAELGRVREELVRKTRLAAIGQVSASVGHELRNPLGSIRNAVYLLRRRLGSDESKAGEYLAMIDDDVNRADRIIADLMEMSRPKKPNRQKVDLIELVEESARRASVPTEVRVRVSTDLRPFMVDLDVHQARQVLNNLFTNSVQAMEGRGEIRVDAKREEPYDIILVADTGPGVPPESRERLFEPLFSTKARGTGLGLAICRQIVAQHGGSIEYIDAAGGGAAFEIRLPRAPARCATVG